MNDVTIQLTDEQKHVLQIFSQRTGRTIEELIENFLFWYINLLKQEAGIGEPSEPGD